MRCFRCSYCCYYLNFVVAPKYIHLEEIDFESDLPEDFFVIIENEDTVCPHLRWDLEIDRAACSIRNKKWFRRTPCYQHNSIEIEDPKECNIGKHITDNKNLLDRYRDKVLNRDKIAM